ncbi:MAG TPA: ABC transporter ATP-binding protein [Nitrososphaerales archaeon]|nr:ABC transporter ATP-binding protein [Nitrososphaerales archaeon]
MESIKSSSNTVQSIISFEDVDYSHPNGTIALRKVNFNIAQSELVAILGANGAGKSTLIRHINGLLKPTRGIVRVFGQDTKFSTPAILSRKVGIVFQNPNNQLFAQSVTKEIEFALKNFGYSDELLKKRSEWALDTFSLREYAERSPMELSGGEKKRLCIALVLSWDPEILILDEPTVGQDSEQKEKLDQIIRLLLSQKKNVILVTHDVEFVWPLQPRTILMSGGEIVADGLSQDVLSDEIMMKKSSIISPQLVDFSKKMEWPKPYPINTEEAERRILN